MWTFQNFSTTKRLVYSHSLNSIEANDQLFQLISKLSLESITFSIVFLVAFISVGKMKYYIILLLVSIVTLVNADGHRYQRRLGRYQRFRVHQVHRQSPRRILRQSPRNSTYSSLSPVDLTVVNLNQPRPTFRRRRVEKVSPSTKTIRRTKTKGKDGLEQKIAVAFVQFKVSL